MNLRAPNRAAPPLQLPPGAVTGFRWGRFARQRRMGLGVDCGAGLLKLVQAVWTDQGPRLENFAVVPLPPGTMLDGAVESPVVVGGVVRAALQAMGATQHQAGAVLGGPTITTRYLQMQALPKAELRAAMRFEAPHHLPIQEDDLVYDFTLVPEGVRETEQKAAIFLAGTTRSLVATHLAALNQAYLRPMALEMDCLAAHRALDALGYLPGGGQFPFLLLDFGESATRLHIFRYTVPMLSRTIQTGLTHLRTAVADCLQLSTAEAEEALRTRGVAEDQALADAVEPWLSMVMEAVARSVEYFLIQEREVELDRVIAIGGGTALPGMQIALTWWLQRLLSGFEQRPLPVEVLTFAGLAVNPAIGPEVQQFGGLLWAALGSALREGMPA